MAKTGLDTHIRRMCELIAEDLNDRKHIHVNDLDADIQREIRQAWRKALRVYMLKNAAHIAWALGKECP